MARLNEPPVPTESIESLKKRFMRQNRDLARVNSTQSVRIRNLENEVSNLLANNLALREELSHHKLEAESGKAQQIIDHTTGIKIQLEERLQEITALISNLGDPPRQKRSSKGQGRISISQNDQPTAPRRRISDMDQEGRLPAIMEHKLYPRRTLEPIEILDFGTADDVNTTDSPEIGPPPVSQFVDEDPVKIDLPRKHHSPSTAEEQTGLDASLSVNLEQRRRRKDGGLPSENRRSSNVELGILDSDATSTLRTGAKRKLSVREDDEGDKGPTANNSSPVRTIHVVKPTEIVEERRRIKLSSNGSGDSIVNADAQGMQNIGPRKVLAAKSVNKSPKKQVKCSTKEEGKPEKFKLPNSQPDIERKERRQQAAVKISPIELPAKPIESIIVSTEDVLATEPETPASPPNIFSPPTSQPSTVRTESRDTPPPANLGSNNEAARPSRRARGAVSYAEPNLRDKMRRPGKELVDAVGADAKSSRISMSHLDENANSTSDRVKSETEAEMDWKDMPPASTSTVENSPLRSKGTLVEALPDTISTHRKRRESLLQQSDSQNQPSSSGNTIIALLVENRKAKAVATDRSRDINRSLRRNTDSNLTAPLPILGARDTKENKPISSSRRFSTLPRETSSPEEHDSKEAERSRAGDMSTSRRRQSSLGIKSSTSRPEIANQESGATDRALKRPTSTIELPTTTTTSAMDSRSDRISARRRSMML